MGYNRSGTRRMKRLKRRKRLEERLATRGAAPAATGQKPATPAEAKKG